MKSIKTYLTLSIILIGSIVNAQSYNNYYGDIVNNYSSDTIHRYLVEFENLGVKEHGTPALQNTLDWLIEKYTNYGYTDIEIDTFNYSAQDDYNLIVTKQGSLYPNTYVIIDGHYDTKSGAGTNDNGSGIAVILETARLLQNVNTEYSIKFINFSGEEDGLIGSTNYVSNVVIPTNMDIKIVFNIDEVGGINGQTNNTIVCERDQNNIPSTNNATSWAYTDTLVNCIELYSNLMTEISYAYSSDYMPFQTQDKIITGLFESNHSPHPHSPTDLLINMDTNYVYEIAQGTIGASLYFAVAHQLPIGINDSDPNNQTINIYPNPTQNELNINLNELETQSSTILITNILGEPVLQKKVENKLEKLNVSFLPSGIYSVTINSSNFRFTEKLIVK